VISLRLPDFLDATEDEWEQFAKAADHKYTKRVQVGTDPHTGRARYRYFYSDASLAHRVSGGERLNLRDRGHVDIIGTSKDGRHVDLRHPDGRKEKVPLHELHERAFEAWR